MPYVIRIWENDQVVATMSQGKIEIGDASTELRDKLNEMLRVGVRVPTGGYKDGVFFTSYETKPMLEALGVAATVLRRAGYMTDGIVTDD